MDDPAYSALRVLLLEDDPLDAELIAHELQRSDRQCKVSYVRDEAGFVDALEAFHPDVVLADHSVGNFGACDALRIVQARRPQCPFLLVSGAFDLTTTACLKSGAVDFVHKSELPRLYPAIRAALDQRATFRKLSDRQRQVLRMLAGGASTKEIASSLGVSVKTVETHRSQVMKRLGVGDLVSLVRYAVRLGIISPIDDSSRSPSGNT